MESAYTYHAKAQYHQQDRSFVELEHGAPRSIHFSAPPEFGGESGLWTPEHFLLSAVASCFIASFRAVASAAQFEFQGIEVAVDGLFERESDGYRFTTIFLRPTVIIFAEPERPRTQHLLEKAARICPVTRSLSAQIKLETKILAEHPVGV
jgi:organic hydroperoxide reductase OsmC/OhrA